MTEATHALKRNLDLEQLVLLAGSHPANDGMCFMEAVAFVAGEPHSDHPACACPVVGAFMRQWNDNLDDAGRQRLKPLIPRLVGSRSTRAVEQRRGWLAADWLVRVQTPAWLRLAKLNDQAAALEALPALHNDALLKAAMPALDGARTAASAITAAARAAARAAAWAAAWDAAWAAARAGTAQPASYDAARAVLKPTELSLQDSALDLVERMLAITDKAA